LIPPAAFRKHLLAWYDAHKRDLPWRQSTDFYRVWLSEIMLQQTRVEAVIPYYEAFLARFPTLEALGSAPESDVLTAWSGLGYYSRARNLRKAAQQASAKTPTGYSEILELPGIGPYTAAAVASIVFGEPHASVDGNVLRVISRLTNDAGEISSPPVRRRLAEEAQRLLAPRRPGDFNQALMELGATVCIPAHVRQQGPRCGDCPVATHCAARAEGRERELPVKARKPAARDIEVELLVLLKGRELFLVRRDGSEKRLAGFYELPPKALFPGVAAEFAGQFTHRIVNDRFIVSVYRSVFRAAIPGENAPGGDWFSPERLKEIPLTTVARKALHLVHNFFPHTALA
jgi:A/G-specific adenine glycosylase